MSPAERFKHGTRARYVAGCRCRPCTYVNTESVKKRDADARAAALALGPRTESHCIGVGGDPCPRNTKLRKDSSGNFCAKCRLKLDWNGLVPANDARRHMRLMSKHGIGRRAFQWATDVADSVLHEIKVGRRKQIRASTEKLILAVDYTAAADGAYVDAAPTWERVARLVKFHGYTKVRIAREIGQKGHALQLGKKRVTVRNAAKIKRLADDADGIGLRE